MLQGTFETLSLPEVLGLLAGARKSGALWLEAGPVSGVVHLADGHCHATESIEHTGPVDSGAALLGRLVEVCFAAMCQETGSFRFADDDAPPWSCAEPVELSDALVEVDRLLKQWREILRVIPSLECRPRLLDALEVEQLVIDREGWALLVAIDGRRTVRELVERTGRPVMDLCQSLLGLVDAGALGVIDPAAARVPEPEIVAEPVPAPAPEPAVAPFAPVEVAPVEAAPAAEVAHAPAAEVSHASAAVVADASAAEVADAPAAEVAHASGPVLTIVPEAPAEPDAPPVPVVHEPAVEAPGGAEAPDKGAFLRLFSGLRES